LTAALPAHSKNVILFISDGMGPALWVAARNAKTGAPATLTLDQFPFTALVMTHSADNRVTDSAAGATALACGQKTNNSVLGQDATAVKGQKDGARLVSLAEEAKALGYAVGLVTNTQVTHATPAGFYAHVNDRNNGPEIARQLLASEVDVCLGGGRGMFPKSSVDSKRFRRVVDLRGLKKAVDGKSARILGLFAEGDLHDVVEGEPRPTGEPTLAEMTEAAIQVLSRNEKGFFLMVEGGHIDGAAHNNDARAAISEVLQYDQAVAQALKRVSDKDTLVLSVSDHETGGVALNGYPGWSDTFEGQGNNGATTYSYLSFATGPKSCHPMAGATHTGVDVALYGWGYGAERVHGTLENTEVHRIALEVLKEKP